MSIITIVTPSFNQAQFIGQTIESILSQEGDFYIDYIIADGGSTDGSVDVIKKYEKLLNENQWPVKCQGIEYRWWSKKDKGQTDAINQGFKVAKGEILAYLNSDDLYVPGVFQIVAKEYSQSDCDLFYGNCISFWENEDKQIVNRPPDKVDFDFLVKTGPQIFQPASFWTKKIYEKVGELDENLHYAMDYDYYLKILKHGKAKYINEILARFRVIEGQKSQNKRNMLKDFMQVNKKYSQGKLTLYWLKQKIKLLFV